MKLRALTALPVYNEARYVLRVLEQVQSHCADVLVVDDGSTDGTPEILATVPNLRRERHEKNRGYGAALRTAFDYAIREKFDVLVTIDCDGQHEPQLIPDFISACHDVDMVSGSRYLKQFPGDSLPPADRRRVNITVTDLLNQRLGLSLTDGFCGFKAYRVESLKQLRLTETGYAMPLELWVQAACLGWRITEFPVPLIYLDLARSFGGSLDDADRRLAHYFEVLDRSLAAARAMGMSNGPAGGGGSG